MLRFVVSHTHYCHTVLATTTGPGSTGSRFLFCSSVFWFVRAHHTSGRGLPKGTRPPPAPQRQGPRETPLRQMGTARWPCPRPMHSPWSYDSPPVPLRRAPLGRMGSILGPCLSLWFCLATLVPCNLRCLSIHHSSFFLSVRSYRSQAKPHRVTERTRAMPHNNNRATDNRQPDPQRKRSLLPTERLPGFARVSSAHHPPT